MFEQTVSPSRTYMALCKKKNGYVFVKIVLPETYEHPQTKKIDRYENNSDEAGRFCLEHTDLSNFILGCITYEDYSNPVVFYERRKEENGADTSKNN